MRIRWVEAHERGGDATTAFEEADLFGPEFLIKRPLLQAVSYTGPERPVLLIDELDRADEEFEAFLLELLSDFQITVPEVGTFRPQQPPAVVITSNRTREIHDALKRRCLYHWIAYPDFDKELAVLHARMPQTPQRACAAGGEPGAAVTQDGPVQAAGRGRDARLGSGFAGAGAADADGGRGEQHARRAPQAPGRHREAAGADAQRDGAEGAAAGDRARSTQRMMPERSAESASVPVMTREIAARMQDIIDSGHIEGMRCVQRLPGNPYNVRVEQFGDVVATMAVGMPGPGWWNRVKGVNEANVERLDEVLSFLRGNGVRGYIDLAPGDFTEALAARLASLGLYAIPNGVVLYGPCVAVEDPLPEGVEIRELGRSDEELDLFARLWAEGFESPPGPETETALRIRRGFFEPLDNRLYVLYEHGKPVGMAACSIKHGIGYLNVAATLPEFRGRRYHTYLTQRRVADAARAGCELTMGFIGRFGSTSQHNMERGGMRIAYLLTTYVDGQMQPHA